MRTPAILLVACLIVALAGCKDRDRTSESTDPKAESDAPTKPRQEGAEEAAPADKSTPNGDAGEDPQILTREDADELVEIVESKLSESGVHDSWKASAQDSDPPLMTWNFFGSEGPGYLSAFASSMRSKLEVMASDELPVDVASLTIRTQALDVDLSQIKAASQTGLLTELGTKLKVDFVGSGELVREPLDGPADPVLYRLTVRIVDVSASETVFEARAEIQKPEIDSAAK